MKLGFLMNALDARGGGMTVYNYADLNETQLGNESIVFYDAHSPFNHPGTVRKYADRFPLFNYENLEQANRMLGFAKADACYILKSGELDAPARLITACHQLNHGVFGGIPHGHRFAWTSEWLAKRQGTGDWVAPPIFAPPSGDLRAQLGIDPKAVVFGRHGSADSFNILFVQTTVEVYARRHPEVQFVFLSTQPFCSAPNVRFLPTTDNWSYLYQFINTCDCMLHARDRGETFGISCAQFNAAGKFVLSYAHSPEKAHLDILGEQLWTYDSISTLIEQMDRFCAERPAAIDVVTSRFGPEITIRRFNAVFLS